MKSFIDSIEEKLKLKRFQVNKDGAEVKKDKRKQLMKLKFKKVFSEEYVNLNNNASMLSSNHKGINSNNRQKATKNLFQLL